MLSTTVGATAQRTHSKYNWHGKPPMDASRVRELFDYDPATGALTWKVDRAVGRHAKAPLKGSPAGTLSHGYLVVHHKRRVYQVSRLAWAHYYGEWPADLVDHIDRDPLNNRIANLRNLTPVTNGQNRCGVRRDSKVGFVGARKRSDGAFDGVITVNKKPIYLGRFATPQEASAAYLAAKARLHVNGGSL